MSDEEPAVLAGFSLVLYKNKGMAELGTEVTTTDPESFKEKIPEVDYQMIRTAISATNKLSAKLEREIKAEISAVMKR